MDKNYIYKSFMVATEQQIDILQKALEIAKINLAYFKGCQDSEGNKNTLKSIEQGETMKFQGKTIFKNKRCNTWYTRYRVQGKQYYISGRTQKEVLKTLKQKLNYVKKEKQKIITLSDWYKQWLQMFKIGKVKEVTIKDYEKTIKYISSNIFNSDIKNITSLQINGLLNQITLERTAQKVYELLNALFSKAKDYEVIPKNIMDIIDKPKHTRERGIALSLEEQAKFIEECPKHIHGDIFLVIMFQGLRIGECLGITGNDIDLTNYTLNINKAINQQGQIDTTKNTQSNRIIPIFKNCIPLLEKYKDYGDKRIFNFSYYIPQKKLKEIIKRIGIRNISLHDLRHTFITNCKNKNIPEHIIQSWVGHTIGSSVTSKIYTHINQEDISNYIEQFNK